MSERSVLRIVRDVHGRLGERADEDVLLCLETLLEARRSWLAVPDPTLWKTGDAHRLLIELAATRLTNAFGMDEHAPAALRTLFDFLDATDRFHPASMRAATLRKELAKAAAKFPAAMADESQWRLAKRLYTAMRADGVDIADDVKVAAWTKAFNTSPAARRRAVLGALLDHTPELATAKFAARDGQVAAVRRGTEFPAEFLDDLEPPVAQPPITLSPAAELADQARASALIPRLVACGRWAAEGKKVTRRGFPSPSDTAGLADALGFEPGPGARDPRDHVPLIRAWRLALDVEALQLHRTQVVADPDSRPSSVC
ncbi:hypothetical protein [Amycolatopsis sp. NBC_00438]|uniref:hypothetical protein n=1 Tax=Amycolatopsis sp. NBC_00438 TaxID=2903558 RepID=UPI002E21825B